MAEQKTAAVSIPAPRKERHKNRGKKAAELNGDAQPSRSKGKEKAVDATKAGAGVDGAKVGGKKKRKRVVPNGLPSLPAETASVQQGEPSTRAARRKGDGESWEPIPIAQNEVSRVPPVWSKDGRFYFTVAHTSVHVNSSTTPNFSRLSTLSSTHSNGHTKPITSLQVSPNNPFQIITSSLDGTIKVWDWVAGRLVRTVEFHEPQARVDHVAFGHVAGKWWMFAAVTHTKQGSGGQKLAHRILRTPLSGNSNPVLLGKLSNPPASLIISPRTTYLVALASTKAYTYRLPTSTLNSSDPWEQRPTCVKFVSDQPFTCGAFCPEKSLPANEEEWFATGDQKGVIRLWHGLTQAFRQVDTAARAALGGAGDASQADLPETERRLPTTSLHWHAHAVSAIAFTPSGSQLLSVGEESVLVQWHLASGRREYIPRLGGRPVISLAVRQATGATEEEWWMALADGAVVRVGGSSGQIANVGQGIRLDPLRPTSSSVSYPLSLHPSTGALVAPSSHPSTLQFIDPISSTVLFDLEVAPSNRVSRRDEKELEAVKVEKVAFSEQVDGKSVWMATMEGREGEEGEGGGLVRNLKFWKWVDDKYMVNTQFPKPHSISNFSSLAFSPTPVVSGTSKSTATPNPYLITTSSDGVAKLWHVRQSKKSEQGKVSTKKAPIIELYWSCRSTFNYRNLPILASAFSPDVSILALAHGDVISLWDVASNILLKVLDCGCGAKIAKVGFVGEEGRWLVGTGDNTSVVVWDLLSCEAAWALPELKVGTLVATASAPFFLVSSSVAGGTTVQAFSPTTSSPLRSVFVPIQISHLMSLPFASIASLTALHLISISSAGEIHRFGDISTQTPTTSATAKSIDQVRAKEGLSIWQEMFGKGAFLEEPDMEEEETATASALQQRVANTGRPADIFQGPSHTMPPTGLLFDAFIDELLSGHTATKAESKDEGQVANGQILYDLDTEEVGDVVVERKEKKVVSDHEVQELEVFFRDLLSSANMSSSLPTRTVSTPLHKNKGNGHNTPKASLLASASKEVEDSDAGTPSGSSARKAGKKRKAPKGE